MLWEENILSNEKPLTVIYYRIAKDGSEIEKAILTPKDANALLPWLLRQKMDFSRHTLWSAITMSVYIVAAAN